MSDLERTVQIIFEAVDSLTGPLTDMSSSLSDFGDDAETVSGEVTDLNSSIESIPTDDVEVGVEVTGDYEKSFSSIIGDLFTISEASATEINVTFDEYGNVYDELGNILEIEQTLTDMEAIQLDIDAGIAPEDIELLNEYAEDADALGENLKDLQNLGPTEISVDVIGEYEEPLNFLEESFAELPDWKGIWLELDTGTASEDIESLSKGIEDLPEEVDIDISTEGDDIGEIQKQIDLLEAKRLAIESGEGLININSTGLEPALEMIMWEIMAKVQLKANEDGAAFLLGV